MIDEKKLIEDLMHNDGMEFNVLFDASTKEAFVNSVQQLIDKLKNGVVNLINAQPKILIPQHKEGWIDTKEELPKIFHSVIINIPNDYPLPTVHEGYLTDEDIFVTLYGEPYTMDEVPFWKPMPEPPKVGGGA